MKKTKRSIHKVLSMVLLSSLLVGTITSPITLNATNVDTEELLDTRAADITKPVIEKVEFPDNGKTVDAGTKLPIYVDAYDTESGINYIDVGYTCSKDGENDYNTVRLNKSDTENRYEGELTALDGGYTKAYISSIRAVDKENNYFDFKVSENGNNLYTFNIQNSTDTDTDIEKGKVNEITLSNNKQQVERGSSFDIEVVVSDADLERFSDIYVDFSNGDKTYSFRLDKSEGKFITHRSINDVMKSGKWSIKSIDGYIGSAGVECEFPNEEFWFEVIGEDDTEAPKIESIKMDKEYGSILTAGDVVNFEIKATDNMGLGYSASLIFQATADIVGKNKGINLIYDESKGVYVGSYTIEENTYPCEWYLNGGSVQDVSGNSVSIDSYLKDTGEEFYFNVTKDGTFVSPSYDKVTIGFYELNKNENRWDIGQRIEKEKIERRTTFKDAGVVFPEAKPPFDGLKFIGWADSSGKMYTDTSEIVSSYQNSTYYLYLYPVFDQDIVVINFKYPNKDLAKVEYAFNAILMPKGSTYGDALKEASEINVENVYSEQEYSWDAWNYSDKLNDKLPKVAPHMQVSAIYPGYKVVTTGREYFNENGIYELGKGVKLVKNGTTFETVEEELLSLDMPKMYPGLRFESWFKFFDTVNGEIVNDYTSDISIYAKYENHIIRFFIDNEVKEFFGVNKQLDSNINSKLISPYEQFNIAYAMVAEKGDIIKVPEISGYKNITWLYPRKIESSYVVEGDMNFVGYGDKIGDPETPTEPETPVVPDTPSTGGPGETTKPEIPTVANRPSAEVIEKVVGDINNAKEGDILEVNMGDATVLPVDFLASARGKDVTIKLIMNGYSWSINGQDIVASSLKDINMEVTLDSNAVPSHVVKSLAGDNPIKQLSLTHNGDFGFKADLTVNVGNEHQGKYGNLYYYDSDGKMVFMNAGTINDKGEVSLSFSHASDYVVVINDKIMDNNETDVPESGDAMNHMLWITSMMASLVVVGMMYNKKRQFIK